MNVTRPKARPATVTNGQGRTHPYIAAAAATIGALDGFPKEMAVRPSQIRASAVESALMIPDACNFQDQYKYLEMPVSIIAGEDDRLIDIDEQSGRLHAGVVQSRFHRDPETGHMVHQTATGTVMSAINEVAREAAGARRG
jgi:pimeloyl-ACP methyl ester carboxylesterase